MKEEEIQQIEKRVAKRELKRAKRKKMKVSGKKVFELQRLINRKK